MKKQIISFSTALIFCASFFSMPSFSEGLLVFASEITSEEMEYDESIQLTDDVIRQYAASILSFSYLFNEDTYKFYDQLDLNNQAAYSEMEKYWTEPFEGNFTIDLAEPLSFTNSSPNIDNWSTEDQDAFWTDLLNTVYNAKNAFLFDHPEVFWLDESSIGIACSKIKKSRNFFGGYTITVSQISIESSIKKEYESVENTELLQSQVEEKLDNFIVPGTDNYSKIKYIHDTIAETATYNLNGTYRDSVYGFFCGPYDIVCEGYAKSFKLICDKENIPCVIVVGNVIAESNVAHMWNYVRMEDGKWYGVDCTWDDLDNEENPVKYSYLLKGSTDFGRHNPDSEYVTPGFVYPELSENSYEYSEQQTEPTETVVKGDYNDNGSIDSDDIEIARQKLLGIMDFVSEDLKHDMNDDKIINVYDYIIMQRKTERGITS